MFSFKNVMGRIKKFALDDEEIDSLRARLITIIQKNFNSICKNIDPLITLIDEIEVEDKEAFFEQRLTSNNLINLNRLSSAESFINKVAVINSLTISDKSKCTILSVFIVQSFCSIKNNKDLALVIRYITLLNYQDANTKELLPLLINQLINRRDNVLEVKDLSSFYETIGLIKTALKDQGPKAVVEQMYRFIKKFTPSTAKDARYFEIKNFKLKSVLAEIYTRHPDLAKPLKDKYSKSKKLFNACGNLFQFKKKQNVLDELGQQQGFKNH
ncbi:MAG: hypothetical protein H2069_06235 [Legionella sp.]|nr:hypothetical protein [Legionella sp.]